MSGTLQNSTSWQAIGETPAQVLNDSTNLMANTTINGVAYGVVLAMYCICINALMTEYRVRERRRRVLLSGLYISIMFAAGTIYCAVNSRESQLAYVNNRNFPGGPVAFDIFMYSAPINIFGATAFFLSSWMNDALLLWRLSVLYKGLRFSTAVVVFGVIIYLATFVMGLVTFIEVVSPNKSLWSAINVKFTLAYYSLTVAYTITITGLMATRILLARRSVIKATGRPGHGSQYLSVAAMIIESSALYTIWAICFLILYTINHPVQYVFLASLSEVQIIAPLLIMYRVSIGKAWNDRTTQSLTEGGGVRGNMTEIVFNNGRNESTSVASVDAPPSKQNEGLP